MRSPVPPRVRWALFAVLGLAAVAVPGVLAVEASRAARRHHEAAERALRDHARFAATNYRQQVITRVFLTLQAIFRPVGSARASFPNDPLPSPVEVRRAWETGSACGDCAELGEPDVVFRIGLADSTLVAHGQPLSPSRRAWLFLVVRELGSMLHERDWDYRAVIDTLEAEPRMLYLTVRRGADGTARAVYGFSVPIASVRTALLRPVLAALPLLAIPPRRNLSNDSLLSVALLEPGGRRVLELSPVRHSDRYAAAIPGGLYLGGWTVEVALNPRTAPGPLIGGLPPSRAPLLIALVVLTALLILATVMSAWRAFELARVRADFVSGVSHELKTPLAQILLFAESVTYGRMRTRGQVRNAAGIIVGETRRLMQLVDNVLLFGRGSESPASRESGIIAPQPLTPLVRQVVEHFGPLAATTESRVRVVRADDLAAPVPTEAVRQILLNLLDNAVKYGPPGQTIGVGLALVGDRARLWVEDEGPGVPEPDRQRVWEPFVRLTRDVEKQVTGSGIGLAVVRHLVVGLGGAARVDAAPGGGACVVVEFPGARLASVALPLLAAQPEIAPPVAR